MSPVPQTPIVEFYYDVSCPFAYLASQHVPALAARTNVRFRYRPVLLGAIYRATAAPQGAAGSASDVFNSAKKAVATRAFGRTRIRRAVVDNEDVDPSPRLHPQRTTRALRLLYSIPDDDDDARARLTHQLFRAYWVEGRNVSDHTVLRGCVLQAGVRDAENVMEGMEGEAARRALEEATGQAVARGSPGVPGFWLGAEQWIDDQGKRRTGRLYWGQDRMHFLEASLLALQAGTQGWSSIERPLQTLLPRCTARNEIPKTQEVRLEFWYDFSSPWAFLGWTQLARLQREFGPRLRIDMKPFVLGILFREIGAPNLPSAAVSEQKRNYSRLDHGDWVRWWNASNTQNGAPDKNIDFYWADKFPIRTPAVLRAALVEPELVDVLYRACWERNLDMSSDNVLASVIAEAGHDADRIMAKASSPEIKDTLRRSTADAKQAGICGVPTYHVFRRTAGSQDSWVQAGDLVWGQDELPVVEDLIAGWDGTGPATVGQNDGRKAKAML